MLSWLRCVALVVFCLLVHHKAQAQTAVLIVIQRSDSLALAACEQRLRSELIAEGYHPTTVQVTSTPNAALLVDTAKRLTSPAAISISVSEGVVSGLVWMVDPKKAGGLLRAVTDYPVGDQTPAVFAVSATDVLHGGLLELGYIQKTLQTAPVAPPSTTPEPTASPPKPPTAPPLAVAAPQLLAPKPPPSVKAKNHQRKHDWQLSVGAEAIIELSDAPVALAPNLTFTRRLGLNWALGLSGHIALPLTLVGPRGAKADVNQFMAGPWLEYRQFLGTHVTCFEFFETGVHYLTIQGRAVDPLIPQNSYSYTVYHQAGAGVTWNTTADFGLWLRTGFLFPWKPREVIIVNETVTKIATPAVLLGGGMAMRF